MGWGSHAKDAKNAKGKRVQSLCALGVRHILAWSKAPSPLRSAGAVQRVTLHKGISSGVTSKGCCCSRMKRTRSLMNSPNFRCPPQRGPRNPASCNTRPARGHCRRIPRFEPRSMRRLKSGTGTRSAESGNGDKAKTKPSGINCHVFILCSGELALAAIIFQGNSLTCRRLERVMARQHLDRKEVPFFLRRALREG
jgi:hypothetical protein